MLRHLFGDDVTRTLQGGLHIIHTLFSIHKGCGPLARISVALGVNALGKRLQPPLPCNRCAGLALRLVGQVQILQLVQGLRHIDFLFQIGGQFALLPD